MIEQKNPQGKSNTKFWKEEQRKSHSFAKFYEELKNVAKFQTRTTSKPKEKNDGSHAASFNCVVKLFH